MSAQSADRTGPYEVIHLGREDAEIEATLAGHDAWARACRPGARPHDGHGRAPRRVTIEWTPAAVASARRYLLDQRGLRAVGAAIAALSDDPYPEPPAGFHRGRYHRLRPAPYRVMYVVDEDVITIERVDRLAPN